MRAGSTPSPEEFVDALFARVPVIWATAGLIALNAIVFALMALDASALWRLPGALLADWGGNYAVQTHGGQPWRLLTGTFIHGGLLHVGLNMLALYQGGQLAERVFGSRRFLLLYLACGLVASVASVWWRPNGLSVGASGAVFGVFGALLGYVLRAKGSIPPRTAQRLRIGLFVFIGYSLIAGLLLPGIDNAAHVGGLLTGVVLGAAFAPGGAMLARAAAALVLALASALMWQAVPAPQHAPRLALTDNLQQRLAASEYALVQRHAWVLAAMRDGRLSVREGLGVIEGELIPGWTALADALDAAPATAWQAASFARYARLRREGLQALAMSLHTGDPRWIELANALQATADELMHAQLHPPQPGGD